MAGMAQQYPPRRARPGQVFDYTTAEGEQASLKANSDGVVRPHSPEEQVLLDRFSLPEARVTKPKAKAPAKAPAKPSPAKSEDEHASE
jgi:hypothetical protein